MSEAEQSDEARLVEAQVAVAVDRLREDVPKQFILVYAKGDGADEEIATVSFCNLPGAQKLMEHAIKEISHQYAVKRAKATTP